MHPSFGTYWIRSVHSVHPYVCVVHEAHTQGGCFPGAGLAVAQDASAQQIRLGKPAGVVPPVQISAHLLGDQRLADKVKVSIMDILPISKDLSGGGVVHLAVNDLFHRILLCYRFLGTSSPCVLGESCVF